MDGICVPLALTAVSLFFLKIFSFVGQLRELYQSFCILMAGIIRIRLYSLSRHWRSCWINCWIFINEYDSFLWRAALFLYQPRYTYSIALETHLVSISTNCQRYLSLTIDMMNNSGIGGFLGAQAERDQFLYYTRTTQERVERSCVGEMEREVHDILARSGVDKVRYLPPPPLLAIKY